MGLNQISELSNYPVLGLNFSKEDYMPIDLSVRNIEIRGIDVIQGLEKYIRQRLRKQEKKIAFGGYGEERDFYWTSSLFKNAAEKRTIHLGIDLWTDADQAIYAPFDAEVHSFKYNDLELDYGYTILLKHSIDDFTFYSLYGHLSDKGFENLKVGQKISKGEVFGYIGHPETNGGWAPHLHLQTILDLEGKIGDYPGVCTKSSQEHYLNNCPKPEFFF